MTAKQAGLAALALLVLVFAWLIFTREKPVVAPVVTPPADTTPAIRPAVRPRERPRAVRPPDTAATQPLPEPRNPGRLRLMAANLSSGGRQNYDGGHGIRIMQGAKPDVVMIQEFNYRTNRASDLQAMADKIMDGAAHYYREAGALIPNGIISRYPVTASGEWDDPEVDNRDFAWARIDIPGPVDLWAVSVHLLTTKPAERNRETQALVAYIQRTVPPAAYLAIGGDFNTHNRNEPCYQTFAPIAITTGPLPADQNGNSGTNAARNKAYDGILVDADLNRLAAPVVIGSRSFASGLVLDLRVFTPISLLAPASAVDGHASSMQHMAVLRDFRLTGR